MVNPVTSCRSETVVSPLVRRILAGGAEDTFTSVPIPSNAFFETKERSEPVSRRTVTAYGSFVHPRVPLVKLYPLSRPKSVSISSKELREKSRELIPASSGLNGRPSSSEGFSPLPSPLDSSLSSGAHLFPETHDGFGVPSEQGRL